MKKFLALFISISLLVTLAACGGNNAAANSAPAEAAEETADQAAEQEEDTALRQNDDATTEIRVFTWGYPAEKYAREQQAQMYMDLNPDVNIIIEVSPDYDRKLATMIASGDGPDVFETSDDWYHTYADELADLNEYVQRDGMDLDAIFDSRALEGYWTDDGKLEALPIGLCPFVMAVNVELFNEAGVDIPEGEWTWDDVLEASLAITTGEGTDKVYGMADSWVYDQTISFYFGGNYYNDEKTQVTINNPEAVAGYQFWSDLMYEHEVLPNFDEAAGVQGNQRFFAGKAGMVPINMWDIMDFVSQIDGAFEWQIVNMPVEASTGLGPVWSIVEGYGIWEGSKNKEAAWEYIKWATTDPAALELSAIAAVPMTHDGMDLLLKQDFGYDLDLQRFVDAVPNSVRAVPGGPFAEINDIINEHLNEIKRGGNVQEVLDAAAEQAQPVLERMFS